MIPLWELLQDKTFNRFFRTTPALYPTQLNRDCWRVWVKFNPNSPWRKKDVRDYQVGVSLILAGLEQDRLHDAALQSRGVSYQLPYRTVKLLKGGRPVLVTGKGGVVTQATKRIDYKLDGSLINDYGRQHWCFYCRRFTAFNFFPMHHNFRGTPMEHFYNGDIRRCTLCGITVDSGRIF